jgi:hypothetical protein
MSVPRSARNGIHEVSLDRHDQAGRRLAAGVYLLRLFAEDTARTEKLVLLR